ncbi:hypothetical protein F4775DRAFT_534713 [Biscogniauxia sp. FL1348]|nr:hypothetical protein F4775DRAFT_534713 [Biscogniauxia sp. FL1348]
MHTSLCPDRSPSGLAILLFCFGMVLFCPVVAIVFSSPVVPTYAVLKPKFLMKFVLEPSISLAAGVYLIESRPV